MKVYIDSFGGLVPCKAIAFFDAEGTDHNISQVRVRVTASRPGYAKGTEHWFSWNTIIPRQHVYRSRQACGQYRVRPYKRSEFYHLPKAIALNGG